MWRGCLNELEGSHIESSVNLCSLIEQFGSENKCREHLLEVLRWPDTIVCRPCKSIHISKIVKRRQFDCDKCRYRFSFTAGTVFNDSHLPLWKWFLCVYLLFESKKGMSANQLKRVLGIPYKTAWHLCHRVRAAMKEVNPDPLGGTVEIDETLVGGRTSGRHCKTQNNNNKTVVAAIKRRRCDLRFFNAADVKAGTLARYIKENISKDVHVIITDEFPAYPPQLLKRGWKTHATSLSITTTAFSLTAILRRTALNPRSLCWNAAPSVRGIRSLQSISLPTWMK